MSFNVNIGATGTGKSMRCLKLVKEHKEMNETVLYFSGVPGAFEYYKKIDPELGEIFEKYSDNTEMKEGGKYFIEKDTPAYVRNGAAVVTELFSKAKEIAGTSRIWIVLDDGWWENNVEPQEHTSLFRLLVKRECVCNIVSDPLGYDWNTLFGVDSSAITHHRIKSAEVELE